MIFQKVNNDGITNPTAFHAVAIILNATMNVLKNVSRKVVTSTALLQRNLPKKNRPSNNNTIGHAAKNICPNTNTN